MALSSHPSGLLFALVVAPLAGLLATGMLVFTSSILPMAWVLGVLAAPVATLTYGRFRDLPPQRICMLILISSALTIAALVALAVIAYLIVVLTFSGVTMD